MGLQVGQITGQAGVRASFNAVTKTLVSILGFEDYGIAAGCHKDLVLPQARDPVESIWLCQHG